MKIGIFGGTFNPPHNSHVRIAKQAKEELSLDRLFVLPCGDPPHKYCDIDSSTRLALTRLAFDGIAEVSDYEIVKSGKSYTVETLKHFKSLYRDAEFFLIMGGDSFASFGKWKDPAAIAEMATLAVAERGESLIRTEEFSFDGRKVKTVFLNAAHDSVSSSEIRLRYQFGMDNSALVPRSVDEYVKSHGLYCEYRGMADKLKSYLKPERFKHTFYVVKRGLEFASPDERDKVFTACLLHDCAKYIGSDRYAYYGYERAEGTPEPVVHAYLGEKVARKDFGVCDAEILDAIKYHTTARPHMTRLDKILYVADKTEETRPYDVSKLLGRTLDETFVKCLVKANEYKDACHGDTADDPLTRQALAFYLPNYAKKAR